MFHLVQKRNGCHKSGEGANAADGVQVDVGVDGHEECFMGLSGWKNAVTSF